MQISLLLFDDKIRQITAWTQGIASFLQISVSDLVKYTLKDPEFLRARVLKSYFMRLFVITTAWKSFKSEWVANASKIACKSMAWLLKAKEKLTPNE